MMRNMESVSKGTKAYSLEKTGSCEANRVTKSQIDENENNVNCTLEGR